MVLVKILIVLNLALQVQNVVSRIGFHKTTFATTYTATGSTIQITCLKIVDSIVRKIRTEFEMLQERNLSIQTAVHSIGLVLTDIDIPHVEHVK